MNDITVTPRGPLTGRGPAPAAWTPTTQLYAPCIACRFLNQHERTEARPTICRRCGRDTLLVPS